MSYAIQYHQGYPDQPGFQFWRDRMVTFEHFGMRWCIVIYGPLEEQFSGQKIVELAAAKSMSFASCVSTSKRNLRSKLEAVLDFTNEELIDLKERDQINIFSGIGIAITVVDSEGCMAYAQAGDAVVMLCHDQHRYAKHRPDIETSIESDSVEQVQQRRSFGTYKNWSGYISPEFQLRPGDGWFISTEGNFLIMHDQVPYEEMIGMNDSSQVYFQLIKRVYSASGLEHAGILAAAKYSATEVHDIIGLDDIRVWHEWKKLDNQLIEDLPHGVLAQAHQVSSGANWASHSSEPPAMYFVRKGPVQSDSPAKPIQQEPSLRNRFRNLLLLAATFLFTSLLRLLFLLYND